MHATFPSDIGWYSYDGTGYANPHAVTSVGGATYTYDNNGNVTAIGSLDYTWDWRKRLASAERSAGGITSYGYDHAVPEGLPSDRECDDLVPQPLLQRRLELAHRDDNQAYLLARWDASRDGGRRLYDRFHHVSPPRPSWRNERRDR